METVLQGVMFSMFFSMFKYVIMKSAVIILVLGFLLGQLGATMVIKDSPNRGIADVLMVVGMLTTYASLLWILWQVFIKKNVV